MVSQKHLRPLLAKRQKLRIVFRRSLYEHRVWINGRHLGNHPYGYTPFVYDITDYLAYDQDNVIAVQVKNEGNNSRWLPDQVFIATCGLQ